MAEQTEDEKKVAAAKTKADAKAAKKLAQAAPEKGDEIKLVTAAGDAIDATVSKANKNGTVDLTATFRGAEIEITGSPRDDSKKLPDSWHFAD